MDLTMLSNEVRHKSTYNQRPLTSKTHLLLQEVRTLITLGRGLKVKSSMGQERGAFRSTVNILSRSGC